MQVPRSLRTTTSMSCCHRLAAEFYIQIGFLRIALANELIGGVPKDCSTGRPACGESPVSRPEWRPCMREVMCLN
jgi:hypothetical protein